MTSAQSSHSDAADALADAIPALVLGFDRGGKIVAWNRELESFTGVPRTQVLGQDVAPWIGEGGDVRLEVQGTTRVVRWRMTPFGSDAAVRYAIGTDVTAERENVDRRIHTERLVAVGALAVGVAHEVRNPLNSALLQLQVLRRRIERGRLNREQLLPIIDLVRGDIGRLERVVVDLLAFAQPRSAELEAASLEELMHKVTRLSALSGPDGAGAEAPRLAEPVGVLDRDPDDDP